MKLVTKFLIALGLAAMVSAGLVLVRLGAYQNSYAGYNVILLTVDTVRADHLQCYGYEKRTSPNISRLAEQGVVFNKAISQSSWTKASMASLFTSLYPHNHKATRWQDVLPLEVITLSEILKENGYVTMGIQTNPFIKKSHNFDQGFDEYLYIPKTQPQRAQKVVDRLLLNIQARRDQKFFAYAHFMDPHLPYEPPAEFHRRFSTGYTGKLDKKRFWNLNGVRQGSLKPTREDKDHIIALHDAEIAFTDAEIGRLVEGLKELGLLEKTVIIIHSDHGEEFWDHWDFEHGHSMYNELLHVPLIFVLPQYRYQGLRVKSTVRLIDVLPTLLGLMEIPIPPVAMGQDLSAGLLKGHVTQELPAFSEAMLYGREQKAIQTDSRKLIYLPWNSGSIFFDIAVDERELRPIIDLGQIQPFKTLIFTYMNLKGSDRYKARQKEFDLKTVRQLKSLGYVR